MNSGGKGADLLGERVMVAYREGRKFCAGKLHDLSEVTQRTQKHLEMGLELLIVKLNLGRDERHIHRVSAQGCYRRQTWGEGVLVRGCSYPGGSIWAWG